MQMAFKNAVFYLHNQNKKKGFLQITVFVKKSIVLFYDFRYFYICRILTVIDSTIHLSTDSLLIHHWLIYFESMQILGWSTTFMSSVKRLSLYLSTSPKFKIDEYDMLLEKEIFEKSKDN